MKRFASMWVCCFIAITVKGEPLRKNIYKNTNYHFCITIPFDWTGGEPFTKNGIILIPKNSTMHAVTPQIMVGAHVNQSSEQDDKKPQTLAETVESIGKDLRQYGAAENLHVINKEVTSLQGLPAQSITLKYRDGRSGKEWMIKDFTIIDKQQIVYFVELKCQPEDTTTMSDVWRAVVRSLHIHCQDAQARP